jgi:plastocyanin
MRGKVLVAGVAFAGGLAAAVVPPSLGANQTVTAEQTLEFKEKTVTIAPGESVTWTNAGGFHNVKFDDGSFEQPAEPQNDWPQPVTRTFTTPGTFTYYCEAHKDSGMTGTVVVTPASTTTPTTPTQPGPGPGGPPTGKYGDKVAPKLTLGGARAQRLSRHRALVISVRVNERATVTARGRVSVPGSSRVLSFKKARRSLAAGAHARLKLRLPRKARSAVRSALTGGKRLRARVTIVATDPSGNQRTARRTIKLRR